MRRPQLLPFAGLTAALLALPATEPSFAALQRGGRGGRGAERATAPAAGRGARSTEDTRSGPGDLPSSDAPTVDLARRYFHMCDQDGDGYMDYYEGRATLDLDRSEFLAAYDLNVDGLCDEDEFRRRYEEVIAKGGAFKPPRIEGEQQDVRERERARELIEEFDLDTDTLLDMDEVEDVLFANTIEGVDLELLRDVVDIDGSGRLDANEVVRLLPLLNREVDPAIFMKAPARSIVELYGTPEEREGGPDWAPEPPSIRGPVPTFHRLDLDRDGVVTEGDLKELLKPLKPPVRLGTVLADLDRDGDGALSPEELRASMTRPRVEPEPDVAPAGE